MVKSEPVVALLLACNWILVTGNGRPDIKIEGALQRYKMSKSFKCGHPVQFYVMHCTCDCHKDTADRKYYEHPRYNEILCKGSSHFCFPVPSKTNHLEINGDDCEAYGI
uniref:Uncharacterized protein n=1 Tax=Strigamia maritima TaxID=126957 RepID=T1J773_STRMM